ncbi:DUF4365 domain-containing protein [Gottfriedia sp. NPDC057948]|uniref:DUF4365 domain-containing protein n=1 Tax=Gottfriedia sp. NPDC057948 TaxID=3346287 RepID=UPI0036D8DED7
MKTRKSPISNSKLEVISVHAIISEALKFDLRADIPIGDKGISFDGKIDVFLDDSEKKESLKGHVPVQVKGTYTPKFTEGNRTFPVEIADLQNYYNSNGVVYFVVEINRSREAKVYFKQLLPTELRYLLNEYGNQGKRNIVLRPLNETTLYRVCSLFLDESKKQPRVILENNSFNPEQFDSFKFTSLTFNPANRETSYIYEHDFTMYGVMGTLTIPIGIARVTSEMQSYEETIIINGNEIKTNIEITKEPEQVSVLIENSIELIILENGKFKFKIDKFISVSTQLKVLPILKAILLGEKIHFFELRAVIEDGKIKDKNWVNRIDELYKLFINLQKVYKMLDVEDSLVFMDEQNLIDNIEVFTDLVLKKDFSKLNFNDKILGFIGYELGGNYFNFFYDPSDKSLIDGYSKDILNIDTQIQVDNVMYPYSIFAKLSVHSLANSENINFDVITESFKHFDPFINENIFGNTNHFCLMCLSAYDLTQKKELLMLANFILQHYKSGLSKESEQILLINKLQVSIRLDGTLTEQDKDRLIEMKLSNTGNYNLQFCANVLLGNKTEADWFFKRFDQSQQKNLMDYPIYTLFQKLTESLSVL